MEYDVVFTDKMDETSFWIFPIFLPIIWAKFLSCRYVADRSIEPNIQYFAFCVRQRHGNTPIQIARDGSGLKALYDPVFTLAVYISFPIALVTFDQPFVK